jgi:tetratricopeptide (TPR) repeat protein
MRWKPFRRPPSRSRDEQLADRMTAAEAAYAADRYELARAEYDVVVAEYRQQLVEQPDDVEAVDMLAAGLNGLGLCLEKLRFFDESTQVLDEAVRTSRQAVELRRAACEPGDPGLARTLRTFALVRANVGVELDEAERALTDALAAHMAALVANPSEELLGETYATELAQAQLLARKGRHVEAARVANLARSGHLDGLLDLLRAQRGPD